jgi:hypothetical protein
VNPSKAVPQHTGHVENGIVRQSFTGHVTSRAGDIAWPARSPDLFASDHFLWGHVKAKPRTLEE